MRDTTYITESRIEFRAYLSVILLKAFWGKKGTVLKLIFLRKFPFSEKKNYGYIWPLSVFARSSF